MNRPERASAQTCRRLEKAMHTLCPHSKSLDSGKLRKLALSMLASMTVLAGCGVISDEEAGPETRVPTFDGKTAEEIANEPWDGGDGGGGKGSTNLEAKWIPCGEVRDFPTWTFWGYTTVEAANHTPNTR